MKLLNLPYAVLISIYCGYVTDTDHWWICRMLGRCFADLDGGLKQAIVFIIMFVIVQQFEGNIIYPHVVGNSVGLPAIWVLVAVTVGGNLLESRLGQL